MKRASLLAVVLAAACSSSSSDTSAPAPVHVLYGPREATRLTPYPSNRYTKADPSTKTGLRVDITRASTAEPFVVDPIFAATVEALDRLDGFSTVGPFVLGFDHDIDPRGVEEALALVDVDETSPERGKAIALVPVYYTTLGSEASTEDYTLVAHPVTPLRQRTRYAFVATDAITTEDGRHVTATDATRALLDSEPGDYAESVRAALPLVLAASGFTRESLTLATVFTTETVRDTIEAMGVERRAAPAPPLVAPFVLEEGVTAPDTRARFVGSFAAPEYRRSKPVGTFELAGDLPVAQGTTALQVSLSFSNATRSGPRPIVLYGHGLGGDKGSTWGTAERLGELDVAVIGIDAPEHGSRSDPPTPDGKSDLVRAVTGFFAANPDTKQFDMERVRDNFRQMASDQLELVRFLATLGTLDVLPVGAPDGVPDLDPTKILYIGHSFGSVLGPTVTALAPEIQAACWNVGGDGLLTLMRDSGLFRVIINSFTPAETPKADIARFFAITQAIVDPADPANYARFTTLEPLPSVTGWRPRDVLLQEVKDDNIVPNSSTEILARALGLAQVGTVTHDVPGLTKIASPATANLPSGATGALVQWARADGKAADHGGLVFTDDARAQYVAFFRTALEGRAVVTSR